MKTKAARLAAALALVALGAPLPAVGQYFPPPLIIVPPPAQNYAMPKSAPKPPPRAEPKLPADTPPQPNPTSGHFQGRTYVPD
jgi:hypothetical protein